MSGFDERYRRLALSVLAGKAVCPGEDFSEEFADYFIRETRRDGIQLLLHHLLSLTPDWARWPEKVRLNFNSAARHDAMIDFLRQQDESELFGFLKKNGIEPILLKGAALSLTHYPQPFLRPRSDTDFLVSAADYQKIPVLMAEAGYESSGHLPGEYANRQAGYSRKSSSGVLCIYDIHARLLNPEPFSTALSYEEILPEAEEVEILGQRVKVPSQRHALLHACMHRAAHHYGDSKLIWLYDIHLIISGKSLEWLEDFYRLAAEKKMRKVCGHSFRLCAETIGTKFPENWLKKWTDCPEFEPSQRILSAKPTLFSVFQMNLSALSVRQKWKLLKEHLFPPRDYMKAKYAGRPACLLPFFYISRIFAGLPKAFFRRLDSRV